MKRGALQVARWEFQRYFKPGQQLVGMIVTLAAGLAVVGLARLASRDEPMNIAVIGADVLPVVTQATPGLRFSGHPPSDENALLRAVTDGELDAVLRVEHADRAELIARRRGSWVDEVRRALAAARQEVMLERSGLQPDALAALLQPPEMRVRYQTGGEARNSRSERIAFFATLSLMLFAVFMGMSYIFTSITGEKQIRVTEQVLSAIPAQQWIDGKIAGLTAVSVASVFNTVISMAVLFVILRWSGVRLPQIDFGGEPITIVLILLFGGLGLLFWFAFLAAIAAMIDDPNNSNRGALLFVPMLASTLGFLALPDPDGAFMRVLALAPPTAPSALPARLLLTHVPAWEITLSLLLLGVSVMLLRIAAARVFRLAMLMHGKEPSWQEVKRWVLYPDA